MNASPESPSPELLEQQLARMLRRIYRLEQALARHGIALEGEEDLGPGPDALVSAAAKAEGRAGQLVEQAAVPAPEQAVPAGQLSLESRIGSQWLNRIGILAVLVGVAWFLKFAIDNAWIGPVARVSIGLAAGIALIAWSQSFAAKGYAAFSYSLKAIGSGVLYLALWAAFSLYHLAPAGVAFLAMVAITAWNGFLAWRRDAELLGFYALVGGFVTPALLATGTDHEAVLFAYLMMLNLALLALAVVKPWPRMAAGAFAGTVLVGGGWASRYYQPADRWETFAFLIVLCLLFAAVPLVMRSRAKGDEWPWLVSAGMPIVNAALGFLMVLVVLPRRAAMVGAGVALAFAAMSVLLTVMATRRAPRIAGDADEAGLREMRRFARVHVSLAAVFVAMSAMLRLHGIWMTTGWLTEGLVLLAAGFWRNRAQLRWLALAVLALTIGKVFLVDVGEKSVGFRIAIFLGLGLVLLGVSFLYQRDWLRLRR